MPKRINNKTLKTQSFGLKKMNKNRLWKRRTQMCSGQWLLLRNKTWIGARKSQLPELV